VAEIEGAWGDLFSIVDPGYKGYSVYRQPFSVDMSAGEIPFALQDMYHNPILAADYKIVHDTTEVRALHADFMVMDAGSVTQLR
jgi:hypothetical protein